ncbi:MAG: adenylyl-sulfate kinase [Lachnospiraceae bacterium]
MQYRDQIIANEHNLYWQQLEIDRAARERQLEQKAFTVWMTGLSGSGKSTVANELEKRLVSMGKHTMLLDGDNVRLGLNSNLGFSPEDRIENIRRVAEVAKLLNDAGIIVITAFISPFHADRKRAAEIIGDGFTEIFIDTPLSVCEERDVKGLYKRARNGEVKDFTGISSPFEKPKNAALTIRTDNTELSENVDKIIACLWPQLYADYGGRTYIYGAGI